MPTPEFLSQVYNSSYYDSLYPEKFLGEQKLLFCDHLGELERLLGDKKGKLLDIGSGRGMFLRAALERGWDCVAQEFSKDAAKALQDKIGVEVIVCNDLSQAGLPSGSFDLINLNHVLEHLYQPVAVIKEIYRMLKPGGLLYCEVPRQNNFLNLLSNILGKKDFGFSYHPEHLFIFSIPAMRILFGKIGFKTITLRIVSIGEPHRFVYGVHYTSLVTHLIVKITTWLKIQNILGGGNLMAIARKPI